MLLYVGTCIMEIGAISILYPVLFWVLKGFWDRMS